MERRFTFSKPEHLCLRSDISALFASGSRSMTVYPIRMVYRQVDVAEHRPAVQVLLSVSKRHFRHAVDRNRVKRLLREAYRHHKHILTAQLPEGRGLHIGFLWLSDNLPAAEVVEQCIVRLLQQLSERLAPKPATSES